MVSILKERWGVLVVIVGESGLNLERVWRNGIRKEAEEGRSTVVVIAQLEGSGWEAGV